MSKINRWYALAFCSNRWAFLAVIVACAFCLRLGASLALREMSAGPGREFGADGLEFDLLGHRLADGLGYTWSDGRPTAFRAPGFPLSLAAVRLLFPGSYLSIRLYMVVLGSFACMVSYMVAREVLPESGARFSAALSAIYFPGIYLTTVFASENLFIPLIGVSAWMLLRHQKSGAVAPAVIAGLSLGLGTLVRPFALLMIVPALFAVGTADGAWRRRTMNAVLVLAALAVPLLPWLARNNRVFHKPLLLTTNGGSTFYGGNNSKVANEWPYFGAWVSTGDLPGRPEIEAAPDEVSHERVEWDLGIRWVREHPADLPGLCLAKLIRFVCPDLESPNRKFLALNAALYIPYAILFAAGVVATVRKNDGRRADWIVLHLMMGMSIVTALVFWGSPRFRDANMPVLMTYAAAGAMALFGRGSATPASREHDPSGARRQPCE